VGTGGGSKTVEEGISTMNYLYWSIYKNLEREVLNLADLIHFADNQISVYSVRIADMLVRSAVEIESLINELFKDLTGEDIGSVGEKLTRLNNEWKLEDKKVSISSFNMHFSETYSTFAPLKYKNKDNNDYYSAYNAVKHNRASNFEKKATLHFLLRAMAVLYVLNVYHQKKELIPLGKERTLDNTNFGSDVFTITTSVKMVEDSDKDVLQDLSDRQAIYIIKANEQQYTEYQKMLWKAFDTKRRKMVEFTGNGNYNKRKFGTNFIELAKEEKMSSEQYKKLVAEFATIDAKHKTLQSTMSFEAILNKNQIIYPAMKKEDI
jgi:hypothetical protein